MKKDIIKVLGVGVVMSVLLTPVFFLQAEESGTSTDYRSRMEQQREQEKQRIERQREENKQRMEITREAEKNRLELLKSDRASSTKLSLEDREIRFDDRIGRRDDWASSTARVLENRQDKIERIQERLASTTASTSAKKIERLENKLEKEQEKIEKSRDHLLNRGLKITEVLAKIADKIDERISILEGKGLNMTAAKTKLAEAEAKIEDVIDEGEKLADLIDTEITDANKDQLFTDIKSSQEKLRTLARAAHSLLVDTVKEITKVLPKKTATTTATSTI